MLAPALTVEAIHAHVQSRFGTHVRYVEIKDPEWPGPGTSSHHHRMLCRVQTLKLDGGAYYWRTVLGCEYTWHVRAPGPKPETVELVRRSVLKGLAELEVRS